jgi:hypothetical protein
MYRSNSVGLTDETNQHAVVLSSGSGEKMSTNEVEDKSSGSFLSSNNHRLDLSYRRDRDELDDGGGGGGDLLDGRRDDDDRGGDP